MENKYLLKRRIEKKLRLLVKLYELNESGIFDEKIASEKEELKGMIEKYINACSHLTEIDINFITRIKEIIQ